MNSMSPEVFYIRPCDYNTQGKKCRSGKMKENIVKNKGVNMNLFSTYKLGDLELSNRMVMAPLTRCRAVEGNVPSPLAVTYYVQRASAGLIISEGSQVSPQGVGYIRTPGIHSPEQVAGWKKVTDAVHKAGGKI